MILLEDVENGVGNCGSPSNSRVGGADEAYVNILKQVCTAYDTAHRQTVAECLAEYQDIRNNAFVLASPHFAGATHTGLYFVEDEQEAVLVSQLAQLGEEAFRRNDVACGALARLNDQCGNIADTCVCAPSGVTPVDIISSITLTQRRAHSMPSSSPYGLR